MQKVYKMGDTTLFTSEVSIELNNDPNLMNNMNEEIKSALYDVALSEAHHLFMQEKYPDMAQTLVNSNQPVGSLPLEELFTKYAIDFAKFIKDKSGVEFITIEEKATEDEVG